MSMSSTNPHWAGGPPTADKVDDEPAVGNAGRWKKVVGVLAAVAVVGGVGFAIGQATAGSSSSSDSPAELTPTAQAQAVMQAAYSDPANEFFNQPEDSLNSINTTILNSLLDEYEADPAAWDDQYLTTDVMESLKTLRDSDGEQVRELSALRKLSKARFEAYDSFYGNRDLAPALAGEGWGQIRSSTYPNPITTGSDKITVYRANGKCWVVARESDDIFDWGQNLNLGSDPIMSIKTYSQRVAACGCQTRRLWYCATYNQCNTYKQIGTGFDGFVIPMNNMRLATWSRIQSTCTNSGEKIVFAGYSRGGGLLAALVHMIRKDNLLPASRMILTTYGSPRSLSKADSDFIHNQFPQYRNVYKSDVVPSIPYAWMGFKHFGDHYCERCSYSAGRDRPNFSLNFVGGAVDHIGGYDTWF